MMNTEAIHSQMQGLVINRELLPLHQSPPNKHEHEHVLILVILLLSRPHLVSCTCTCATSSCIPINPPQSLFFSAPPPNQSNSPSTTHTRTPSIVLPFSFTSTSISNQTLGTRQQADTAAFELILSQYKKIQIN